MMVSQYYQQDNDTIRHNCGTFIIMELEEDTVVALSTTK